MKPLATRLLALLVLCLAATTAYAQNPQVTFQLDARTLYEACQLGPDGPRADATVSLRGNWNEYVGVEMTDTDGDSVFTATVTVPAGDWDYKFYHSELEWEDGVDGSTHPDGNRQITVTDEATQTVEPVAFNKTFDDVCGQQNTAVTFQVDATNLVEACQLGPDAADADAALSIVGDFNGWGGGQDVLTDEDGDGIYTVTISMLPGDYGYKVYHSGFTYEEGDNRSVTAAGTEMTLDAVTYQRSEIPNACGAQAQCVDVFFRVNMGPRMAAGEFDPETHLVTVAGPHVGWSTTADTLTQEVRDPNVYSTLVQIEEQLVPGEIEHKFVQGTKGEAPGGWEEFNGNRFLEVTGEEEDLDGNGCIDVEAAEVPFFNKVGWGELFAQDATVTLEVDLRPAYYFLADSGFVPTHHANLPVDERLNSIDSLFVNGPLAGGWADDWGPDGLGTLSGRKLVDDGTQGDRVAGDSIFTWQTERLQGTSRRTTFKLGVQAYDNENAGGADHRLMIPDEATPTLSVVFGAAQQEEDEYESTLYYPYISLDENGEPIVVRRGGDIVPTSVERVESTLPQGIVLGGNYPNPFNPSTTFEYRIDAPQHVEVRVYDVTGRVVAKLVDAPQPAGAYSVRFEAGELASGLYLYQLRTPTRTLTKKMMLVR